MSTDGTFHGFWSAGTCLNLHEFPNCVVLGARLEPGSSRLPSPCCLVSTGSGTYDHTCFGVWGRVQNNKFTWAFLKERCSQMPTAITTETFDRPGSWISIQLRSEGLSRSSTFGSLGKSNAGGVAFPSSASELFAAEGGWGRHGGPPSHPSAQFGLPQAPLLCLLSVCSVVSTPGSLPVSVLRGSPLALLCKMSQRAVSRRTVGLSQAGP